jgi:hypothetical protein
MHYAVIALLWETQSVVDQNDGIAVVLRKRFSDPNEIRLVIRFPSSFFYR